MIWQYIITILSAVMLFGFVALCVHKFGWKSCYSAYGVLWDKGDINTWSAVTIWSAFLLVPVLLSISDDSPYQFLGFLAPVSLLLVGATPYYATDKVQAVIHPLGALAAVAFITLYSIAIPHLLWIVLALASVALIIGYCKKGTMVFWLEMAMYMSCYVICLVII